MELVPGRGGEVGHNKDNGNTTEYVEEKVRHEANQDEEGD